MSVTTTLVVILVVVSGSYFLARRKALRLVGGHIAELHSLPNHYGLYAVVWTAVPAVLVISIWLGFGGPLIDSVMMSRLEAAHPSFSQAQLDLRLNDIKNFVQGDAMARDADDRLREFGSQFVSLVQSGQWITFAVSFLLSLGGGVVAMRAIDPTLRARPSVERVIRIIMVLCSTAAVLVTVGIVLSLLFETLRFFTLVPISEFLFGVNWSPQTALRADQVASEGAFGAVPLFAGTLLITFIAMLVAVPVGLMSAIYMTQFASSRLRSFLKPMLEVLAGIPTVVYGFFAALVVAPFIREFGGGLGLDVASESALAAGLVMGLMIIPFMSSLSDDALTAVPQTMRDGSYALGATRAETIRSVLVPAALPGIVGAFLLAVSRAIGETMIVVMAAGLAANLTANPLEAVTTVTVQIVTLLTGDQEFDSAKTLAAFALGLVLFFATLLLNIVALNVVRKYREQYE